MDDNGIVIAMVDSVPALPIPHPGCTRPIARSLRSQLRSARGVSEREHEQLLLTPPSQQTVSDPSGVKTRLVLPTHVCGEALALAKIIFDLHGVAEDIADDFIHLFESEGRILLHDPLRRHTLSECGHHGVEGDASGADAHRSIGIAGKRDRLGGHHKR
jgi:hypothetical protein